MSTWLGATIFTIVILVGVHMINLFFERSSGNTKKD
jgi:hypothetical protein